MIELGYDDDFDDTQFYSKNITVDSSEVKHIIGRGGHTLRKLESFVGVFAFVVDRGGEAELVLVGRPRSCLLGEFIVELILMGHHSIMESLAANGF